MDFYMKNNFASGNDLFSAIATSEVNARMALNKEKRGKQMDILVEICAGRDTSKHGAEVDKVVGVVNKIFDGVKNKNEKALAELNAVQTIVIERPLVRRLEALGKFYFGERVEIKDEYRDTVEFEYAVRTGESARIQDYHASFPFADYINGKSTMKLAQITSGAVADYYRMQDTSIVTFAKRARDAIDELYNKTERYVVTMAYEMIKNSSLPIKLYNVGVGGISKAYVDSCINKLRRVNGQPPIIFGTYTMISQMDTWDGFDTSAASVAFSEAHMNEIRENGHIGKYHGCPVVLINEGIDLDKVVKDPLGANWYGSVLPEGLMYMVPSMVNREKAIKFAFGNLKTMTGTDINNATYAQRWDMAFGAALIPTALPFTAFIGDDRYPVV